MILLSIFLIFFNGFVQSQDCGNVTITNCKTCTATNGCGWCAPTQECIAGDISGPSQASGKFCYGPAWEFGSCTECASLKTCRTCLNYNADCFWCESADPSVPSSCQEWSKSIGCQNKPNIKSCPCNDYKTGCSDCVELGRGDCFWCDGQQKCLNSNTETDKCPANDRAFTCECDHYKSCQDCRAVDGCHWCNRDGKCVDDSVTDCPSALTCDLYCQSAGSKSCTDCNNINGCTWCNNPGASECVATDVNHPECLISHSCPVCETSQDCDACTQRKDCKWCSDLEMCVAKTDPRKCLTPSSGDCNAYCNIFSDNCDVCSSKKGCKFCGDTKKCYKTSDPCLTAHTCPKEKSSSNKKGFDGGSFVGGMFLVIGVIGLGIAGFLFYRWQTGRGATYTELK